MDNALAWEAVGNNGSRAAKIGRMHMSVRERVRDKQSTYAAQWSITRHDTIRQFLSQE